MASMKSTRETIQKGLSSVESCSPDVLGLLRDLLNPPSSKAPLSKSISKSTTASQTTKAKPSRKATSDIEGSSQTATQCPNQAERIRIATESVNASLRTLTNLVKQRASSPAETTAKAQTETLPIKTKLATSKKIFVLQSKDTNKKSVANSQADSQSGTSNVVECCKTAISYLYSMDLNDLASLTAESAHSTLIGKLIALDSYALASKELLVLKRRLVQGLALPVESGSLTEESLQEVLEWTALPNDQMSLTLVIACQLNALRLVVATKDTKIIEDLRDILRRSNSPLETILKALPHSDTKAIRNLETLSAFVSTCVPFPVSSDSEKLQPSWNPKAFIQLYLLAQEYKITALNLQPVEAREKSLPLVWDAVYRCVLTFSRRASQNKPSQNYKALSTPLKSVLGLLLPGHEGMSDPSSIQKYLDVNRIASNLAQDAGLWTAGVEWTDMAVNFLGFRSENDAARVACQVRIATLAMKSISASEPIDNALDEVNNTLKLITTPFSGPKDDVERLLQDIMLFRRAAMAHVAQKSQDIANDEVVEACTEVAFVVLKFFRRWLKAGMCSDKQERKITPMAISIVDSVISLARMKFKVSITETWKLVDLKLQECLALANLLPSTNKNQNAQESLFVKISTAYQTYAALYRKANDNLSALVAMRKSVSSLVDRPLDELSAGNFASKQDRLASYYCTFGETAKAREHLVMAFHTWASTGTLQNLAKVDLSLSCTTLGNSETTAIARAFSLYVKCLDSSSSLWDDDNIDVELRGFVLEMQVKICLGTGSLENKRFAQMGLAKLLSLYTFDFPVRRARTVAIYLQLAFDCPEYVDPDPIVVIAEEVMTQLSTLKPSGPDAPLLPQLDFTIGSIMVMIGMISFPQGGPKPEQIQKGLDAWKQVFDSCKDEKELRYRIPDCEGTVKRLESLVSFLEFKGFSVMRVVALECLLVAKSLTESTVEDLVKYGTILGMQYLRLGYSGKAGRNLAKAQSRMDESEQLPTAIKLQWHLAYAEYLIMIGKPEVGAEHIELTAKLVEEDDEVLVAAKSGAHFRKRVELNCLVAKASYVLALLHFEKGDANAALAHAKRNDKLLKRAWAGLEHMSNRKKAQNDDDDIKNVVDGLSRLSTSNEPKVVATTLEALSGPLLWPIVYSLYSGLILISSIYQHQGMSREAEFYLEQAKHAADAVDSTPLLVHALTTFGDLKIRRGAIEDGKAMLEEAEKLRDELLEKGKELVALDCSLGNMYRKIKIWDMEFDAYVNAEHVLEELMTTDVTKNTTTTEQADLLPGMVKLSLEDAPKTNTRKKRAQSVKTKTAPAVKEIAAAPAIKTATIGKEQSEWKYLLKMKGNVLRSKAINLAMQQKCEVAEVVLKQAEGLPSGAQEVVAQRMAIAKTRLIQAVCLINEDPIYNALQESTIAIPSIVNIRPTTPTEVKVPKRTVKGAKSKMAIVKVQEETCSEVMQLLSEARDCIMEVQSVASKVCSTSMAENVISLYSGINVLLAAVSSGKPVQHPFRPVYSLEMQKNLALGRERHAIAEEKFEDQTKEELTWPALRQRIDDSAAFDLETFQQTYIDIIPSTWTAVSISLVGDEKDELYLTRFRAGQKPFLLRIPLKRETSSEDESPFAFKDGLEELEEILSEANVSTHDAKEMTSNGTRAAWWEKREALDTRLKDLLQNIENIWLGGFKGMLRTHCRQGAHFAKFKASFSKILEEHLPSRQGNAKNKTPMVTLDSRIIELFLSIGNPNEEDTDLDEPLKDLIYFVVDILRFNGENIAFDEVDDDAMIVELSDEIQIYHEAVKDSSDDEVADHTILILDKSVHMFPWESLPCLQDHAVSRLPSLASLREQILKQQKTMPAGAVDGLYIDRLKGSYVLNPGSDLVSTQKMFEDGLKSLTTWKSITQRAPTEQEFKQSLEEQDLFLYFGHGNGSQYIRARTVKKLDRCAVALLLGCSSGKLEDAGDYEPYGAPVNYLHGGCSTLVATLWDVTDKDIDRFSKTVFEKWGLFATSKSKTSLRKGKGKGKQNVKAVNILGDVSLVAAVSKGRESCKLKYLNGAAPVVYGIPVYFA